jgi:hypothetical protein
MAMAINKFETVSWNQVSALKDYQEKFPGVFEAA